MIGLSYRWVVLFFVTLISVCSFTLPTMPQVRSNKPLEPTIQIQYQYYSISGATASDLRSQMKRHGPRDSIMAQRFDARVDWRVNWSFRYAINQHQCTMQRVTTKVHVTYTLPQWIPPTGVARSLVTQWNHYLEALQHHEDGHKDHGVAASQAILRTLTPLTAASCRDLEHMAKTAAQKVIQTYNQKDLEYDRLTRHGYTQGAVFPAPTTVSR
jgi:predicted secreted Zn-dependent protease